METLSPAEQRKAISLLRREERKEIAREKFYAELKEKCQRWHQGHIDWMAKPSYKYGYKLSDELQVEPEIRAYVSYSKQFVQWYDLFPDHKYNNFKISYHGSCWHLK